MAGGVADRTGRLAVAAHPAVVAALVVLVVNDRVLKTWSGGVAGGPGLVARTATGKASDLAGVLLLAVLAGLALGRRRAAVALVGLGFAALKLSPAVADLAVPVLGGRTRTDPWDLLALVALVPADRLLRRVDERPAPDLRPAWASLRATLGLAVVVVSVPAMTATSCPSGDRPAGIDTVAELDDGTLAAALGYRDRDEGEEPQVWYEVDEDVRIDWYLSTDGGRSWSPGSVPRREEAAALARSWRHEACSGATCWRIDDRDPTRIVETSPSGTREVSTLSGRTREELDANRERGSCVERTFVLGTEIVAVDGGAVATGGEYGVTRLEPGGRWESVPVGPWEPPHDLRAAWPRHLINAPAVGVVVWVSAPLVHHARRPARRAVRWYSVGLVLIAGLPGYWLGAMARQNGETPRGAGIYAFWATVSVVGVGLLPLVISLAWAAAQDRRRRRPPPGPAPDAWPAAARRPPSAGR